MRTLYIIPARAGSKGLPGKNTKILGGKPLVEYSIDFALANIQTEDELCISTNDQEVIKIAESKGVTVPFIRPDELSNDTATSYEVVMHAIDYYENQNIIFDRALLLQPTSPFREREDIFNLFHAFEKGIEMVVSVSLAKENPYFTLFEEKNGLLEKCKKGSFTRRQDCPDVYSLNGSMYLIDVQALKIKNLSDFSKIRKIIMPTERSIDIDSELDWKMAEYVLETKSLRHQI